MIVGPMMRIYPGSNHHSSRLRRQSGLTLLEIMVTLVILSLGLLGLAGLQMTGLKNNRAAYYNAVAGQAVQDISERLRVDVTTRNAVTGGTVRTVSGSNDSCNAEVDTFNDRVACVASNLPNGQARIAELIANPKSMYIAMRWTNLELNGARGWAADTARNPATSACGAPAVDTSCFYVAFRP